MSLAVVGRDRDWVLDVFNRIRGLYARYADRHLFVTHGGHALPDFDGQMSGHLDRVTISGPTIRFEGWTTCDRILVTWPGGRAAQHPRLQRDDVADALGIRGDVGFVIEVPRDCGPYDASLRFGDTDVCCRLHEPEPEQVRRQHAMLRLRFSAALMRALPAALMWSLTKNPLYRARVKTRLGLDTIERTGQMDPAMLQAPAPAAADARQSAITIVLPVYNAFDLLPDVLARVETHTDLPWRLILIEDKSSDERVRPYLRDWTASRPDRVTLIENDENLGFIRSVNKGLAAALASGRHVVLLNSDAFVPAGWASRLLRPILTRDNVATTTPMSNDAEIFTVPAICAPSSLPAGAGDAIDSVARQLEPDAAIAQAPTGVGFCMAINRDYLKRLPELDTAFGRGYGEEVDWCQKARARGGRHLGVASLFVEHRGGESFGSEEKRALILHNNALIARRYPTYDAEVQRFVEADPLVTARLALGLAHVAATEPDAATPVYLAHSLGGGAEIYLQDRVRRDLDRGRSSVILRVGGAERFRVELRTPAGETSGTTDLPELVETLLASLGRKRIIYSCGVGDPDAITLPEFLLQLRNPDAGDAIELLVHDFLPVSPSYCLLDLDGGYRGPVTPDRDDPAHTVRRPNGDTAGLAAWQQAWGRLIGNAETVTVFSQDSKRQFLAAYPEAGARIAVTPHRLLTKVPRLPAPTGETEVIGVLGNIGQHKGAEVLQGLARAIRDREDVTLALIGDIDPAYPLPPAVPIHGSYRLEDLGALARRYAITCWLIPSVCPETFSYTTHECLATGLPVYAFDIGAQGDAVRAAKNGRPVAFSPDADLVRNILETLDLERSAA